MMQRLVTERMVEMVFAPLDEVAAWANRIGLRRRPTGKLRAWLS